MTVLVLTNEDIQDRDTIANILKSFGDDVIVHTDKVDADFLTDHNIDFIVSDRYRHIVREPVITMYYGRIINMHNSLLPWCRGDNPNFWSFVDDTPKGGTIHYIDAGVDTGDIIVQKEIHFDENRETLSTTHARLKKTLEDLLSAHWEEIKTGSCPRIRQQGEGTRHYKKEFERHSHLLTKGWDTPASELKEVLKRMG